MHPWFLWLRYINPIQCAFEALMVNEFHGQEGLCSVLVPSDPGFENINTSNQVCAVTGSKSGLPVVSGDDYLSASFGYAYSHLRRNLGIMVVFWIGFVIGCALATEFNPPAPPKGEFLVFRKGHEPEHIKKALASGKPVDDLELGQDAEVLSAHGHGSEPVRVSWPSKSQRCFYLGACQLRYCTARWNPSKAT